MVLLLTGKTTIRNHPQRGDRVHFMKLWWQFRLVLWPVILKPGINESKENTKTIKFNSKFKLVSVFFLVFFSFFLSYCFYTSIKCMLPGMLWTLHSALAPLGMSHVSSFVLSTNQVVLPIKLTHHKQVFLWWFLLHSLKVVLFITHWKYKITKKIKWIL